MRNYVLFSRLFIPPILWLPTVAKLMTDDETITRALAEIATTAHHYPGVVIVLNHDGRQVLYLGPNLPLADVVAAARAFRPTVLATALTTAPARGQVQSFAAELRAQCPETTVMLFGSLAVQATGLPEGCLPLACLHEFRDLIPFVNQPVTSELVER